MMLGRTLRWSSLVMLLLAPPGLATVEDAQGRVFKVSDRLVEVPEALAAELLETGQFKSAPRELLIGPEGPRGEHGMDGLDGNEGIRGERGLRGFVGPTGATGPRGLEGERGATGPKGERGATGDSGLMGWGGGGAVSGDGSVPYFIPSGQTFTIPIYRQALFETTIDCEGLIDCSGLLIMVN
jgi:hypothetical protein